MREKSGLLRENETIDSEAATVQTSNCSTDDSVSDGEMREDSIHTRSSDSEFSHPTTPEPFVDLQSLGLRRSGRKRTKSMVISRPLGAIDP